MEMGAVEFAEKLKKRDALKLEYEAYLREATDQQSRLEARDQTTTANPDDPKTGWFHRFLRHVGSKDTSVDRALDAEIPFLELCISILKHNVHQAPLEAAHRGMATLSIQDQADHGNT